MAEHIIISSNSDGFRIEARISLRPHSAVGCWYNNSYVVSSDHKLLAHTGGVSASLLWMNRLAPELANDFTFAGMRSLFKFYNTGGDRTVASKLKSTGWSNRILPRKLKYAIYFLIDVTVKIERALSNCIQSTSISSGKICWTTLFCQIWLRVHKVNIYGLQQILQNRSEIMCTKNLPYKWDDLTSRIFHLAPTATNEWDHAK